MSPGYQGSINEDNLPHRHDALSGDEFAPGLESENPEADKKLKHEIKEKLQAHVELDISEIKIDVKNGYVSINGKVENANEKSTIEAIVASNEDVIDVVNFLQLRSPIESGWGNGLHKGTKHP